MSPEGRNAVRRRYIFIIHLNKNTMEHKQMAFIGGCYYGYHANNKLKTFLDIGRSAGLTYMSARGIQDKYGCDVNKYFRRRLSTDSLTHDEATRFCSALLTDLTYSVHSQQIQDHAKLLVHDWNINMLNADKPNVPVQTVEQAPAAPAALMPPAMPVTTQQPEKIQAAFSLNLNVADMVSAGISDYINNSGVLNHVNEQIMLEASKLRPNEITVNSNKPVTIEGKLHKDFQLAMRLLLIKKQIYIAGAAGTGKTTLAGQCAKAMGLKFGHMSVSAGISEAHLLGRMSAHGDYLPSMFADMYENGGLFLLDEIDSASPDVILVINSALANGHMSLPSRVSNNIATRHDQFYVIAAGNTFGNGSVSYSGRQIQDAAFMDRFVLSKIHIDYDMNLEREISSTLPLLAMTFHTIRANVTKHKIDRPVSTRTIADGIELYRNQFSLKDILDIFFIGWNAQEKQRAMENVNI